jgi:hypothetical protein
LFPAHPSTTSQGEAATELQANKRQSIPQLSPNPVQEAEEQPHI